ncbi:tripartite tricarboxylate transporter substrate-binding protein [Curvibacter sp. HBC28]|uniref:Tripartite tricarboxylate transporter substrate-binding protein n=1 Tax=Curvibacter microcysteis TaxID=3026419 RepID=A0ABT5M9U9_9BURK|nr:tripartite tricarboxylate transporter substrate-binding protein [Curvibacter sp. HBC28]MDD0813357.1 tripartite tricarboxylate transporter substrate-binding protein [Curvibacter sp. HBC28]
MIRNTVPLFGLLLVLLGSTGLAQELPGRDPALLEADCVIPAKAGGGFALTCALARDALQAVRPTRPALNQRFLPGGIGAVAFDRVAKGELGGASTLVAFSSGSLLNMAQGRFGPHPPSAMKPIAVLGTDYGVIAVAKDSPYKQLSDLILALKQPSSRLVFGAGGTIGSQDWVKAALLVRAAGGDHRALRFVSFEGGGDALSALQGRHIDVFPGDAAEALKAIKAGVSLRFLAVLSAQRLGGALEGVPTAREQGVDVVWPTVRGVYVSANTPDAVSEAWSKAFREAMEAPGYGRLLSQSGLYPHAMTGSVLKTYTEQQLGQYGALAAELGLRRWAP